MADLRKPVFVANSAAILGCTKIAEYLFQYDEVEAAPIQITNGLGAMPPEDSIGKYQIWTDTFTLGMTSLEEASPIFYSADSNSDEDILSGVNTIAGRLGLSLQTNVTVGKTWLEGLGEVYVHVVAGVNAPIASVGLIAHLDSSDSNSYSGPYPGSGEWLWNDLTYSGNIGKVSPVIGYDATESGGVYEWLTEGTINDNIYFNEAQSVSQFSPWVNPNQTIQMWVYLPDNAPIVLFKKQNLGFAGWNLTFNNNGSNDDFSVFANGYGMGPFTPSNGTNMDGWNLITMQWKELVTANYNDQDYIGWRIFVNDTAIPISGYADNFMPADPVSTWSSHTQETEWLEINTTNSGTGTYEYTGKVGAFYFYDRILTDQEVSDNYNNTKSRFGL